MHTSWDTLGAFVISLLVAYVATPLARIAAIKFGILDKPEDKKSHLHPTPLLGGVAIYIAFMLGIIFAVGVNKSLLGIFIGATILFAIGIIDDKNGMMPRLKLTVQVLAALTAFKFGLQVITIEDYYLSMVFTVFWIVGVTNAFNLLDNLNGLSSGIAAISSAFFFIIAFLDGDYLTATLAASITGSCLGFVRFNFPKAQIFMGDAGSLILGFLTACLAVIGSWKTEKITLSLSIPIIILAYPIFDTTLVTIIRIMERRPVFQGGKDHSSHILAHIGFKKKNAVLLIFAVCVLLGICSLVVKYGPIAIGLSTLYVMTTAMFIFGLRLVYLRRKMVRIKNGKQRKN